MSDYINLVPNYTCQKYNHQEPVGSASNHLPFVLNMISQIITQNKIATPFISNTYKMKIIGKL